MQIFKKEKKVVELALRHADKTGESLAIMTAELKAVTAKELADLDDAAERVNELETEADALLREIRDLLYSGAYLPTIRGDLYRLLSAVDKVTNRIEGCLDFVSMQRPAHVDAYAAPFSEILDMTAVCYDHLKGALRAFLKPKGEVEEVREHSRQVSEIESQIDRRERALSIALFGSDLELAEKMHVAELLSRIVSISDQIENTADELQLLSLKSII